MATEPPTPDTPAPKGLWKLMQGTAPAAPSAAPPAAGWDSSSERPGPIVPSEPAAAPRPADPTDPDEADRALAALIGIPADEPLQSVRQRLAGGRAGSSLRARLALVLGVVSIPSSALALISAPWSRLPALAAGFAAIVLGLTAICDPRRGADSRVTRKLAVAGIVTGVLGMFLGPIAIAPQAPPARPAGVAQSAPGDEEEADETMPDMGDQATDSEAE